MCGGFVLNANSITILAMELNCIPVDPHKGIRNPEIYVNHFGQPVKTLFKDIKNAIVESGYNHDVYA